MSFSSVPHVRASAFDLNFRNDMEEHELQQILSQIREKETPGTYIDRLIVFSAANGLNHSQLSSVFDLILSPSLPPSIITKLINSVLVPSTEYLLSPDLFSRLLAAMGPSEVYYRNGNRCKLNRLTSECQVSLLQWLVEILPFFGKPVFKMIRFSYPILFNLLSYEYSRPYIASLIIYGAIEQYLDGKKIFKIWHRDLVADLYKNSSSDSILVVLLWYVCQACSFPKTESNYLSPSKEDFGKGLIRVTGDYVMQLVRTRSSHCFNEILLVCDVLKSKTDELYTLSQKRKRIKLSSVSYESLLQQHSTQNEIRPRSIEHLVENFDAIHLCHPSFVLRVDSHDSRLNLIYISLALLDFERSLVLRQKLVQALQMYMTQDRLDNNLIKSSFLVRFLDYGCLISKERSLLFYLEPSIESLFHLQAQIELIPYLSIDQMSDILKEIIINTKLISRNLSAQLFSNISLLFRKISNSADRNKKQQLIRKIRVSLNEILPCIYEFTGLCWRKMSLQSQLSFLQLLRSLKELNFVLMEPWNDIHCIVPLPFLIYQVLLTPNPLIASEILGFITYLKTVRFPNENSKHKKLINAYVFDSVNFYWKNLAFKSERNTFNKGMYLNPQFIHRMGNLSFFGSSDLILLNSIGDFARNPAFAYMFAELVWALEDDQEEISARHPGPLSETSVVRIQKDPDFSWIRMSYLDIKCNVLGILVDSGFRGLGDFLYSSVRSLKERKIKQN